MSDGLVTCNHLDKVAAHLCDKLEENKQYFKTILNHFMAN